MPGEHHPLVAAEVGPGHHRVAVPVGAQMRAFAAGRPRRRRRWPLVARDGLDVDQGAGEHDRVDRARPGSAGWPWAAPLPPEHERPCQTLGRAQRRHGRRVTVRRSRDLASAWGIGLATVDRRRPGARHLVPGRLPGRSARRPRRPPTLPAGLAGPKALPALSTVEVVRTVIGSLADPIKDAADAYLRLHLLSHRLVRAERAEPRRHLRPAANVAWTSAGPCPPDRVDELRLSSAPRAGTWRSTGSTSSRG